MKPYKMSATQVISGKEIQYHYCHYIMYGGDHIHSGIVIGNETSPLSTNGVSSKLYWMNWSSSPIWFCIVGHWHHMVVPSRAWSSLHQSTSTNSHRVRDIHQGSKLPIDRGDDHLKAHYDLLYPGMQPRGIQVWSTGFFCTNGLSDKLTNRMA